MDEDTESKIESYVFIGLTSILSLYILIGAYINSKKVDLSRLQWNYVHESLIILLIAAPFAYFLPILMTDNEQERESYKISPKISPDIIFNYLLPPIIMSAGFNMRKKFFFKNLGYIGLFGFVGTVINFIIVTTLIYWANSMIGIEPQHYNKYLRITQLEHHNHHVSFCDADCH